MTPSRPGALAGIGGTPIVRLSSWTGPSGGANILSATRLARELGPGHRVVTVQPDSGLKYLAGDLYR